MADNKKTGVVVRPHGCQSDYQDKRYGKNMRVFNCGVKNPATCTVCGKA